MLEGVFHTDESDVVGYEEDTKTDWCDLGTETETELEANLEERLKDAHDAVISEFRTFFIGNDVAQVP